MRFDSWILGYAHVVLDIYIILGVAVPNHTVHFIVPICPTQTLFMGTSYETKKIINYWHTILPSSNYYITKWGLTHGSLVMHMWCRIYTYTWVWQYQITQYILEYLFSWLKVCLVANITKQRQSLTTDTLCYVLIIITSYHGFWLMVVGLYSCGVGYRHIPCCDSTKSHSTFLSTNLHHLKYVCGKIIQNKDNHSLLTH